MIVSDDLVHEHFAFDDLRNALGKTREYFEFGFGKMYRFSSRIHAVFGKNDSNSSELQFL